MNSEVASPEVKQVIITMDEHQRLQTIAQEKQILDSLMRTNAALLSGQGLAQVLDAILNGVQSAGFDRVRLYLLSEDGHFMIGEAEAGMEVPFKGYKLSVVQDPYLRSMTAKSLPSVFQRLGNKALPNDVELDRSDVTEWIYVPLVQNEEVTGLLVADNKVSQQPISAAALEPFALFATHAAVAITNARLLTETKQKAAELEALHQTTLAITSKMERDQLLLTIVQQAVHLLRAKSGGIYQYEPERKLLALVVDYGRSQKLEGSTLQVGEGLAGWLVETGTPSVVVDDYSQWTNQAPIYKGQKLFGAVIEALLRWQGQTIGVLYIDDEVGREFTRRDRQLLQLFAEQAAIALQNARLAWRDAEKLQYLEKLSKFSSKMMSSLGHLSLDDQLMLVAKYATEILQAESAGVLLVKRSGVLSLEASYGHRSGGFEKGRELLIQSQPKSGLTGHIAYAGELFRTHGDELTNHFAVKGEAPPAASGKCHSLLAVPLKREENGRNELLGLLRIDNRKDSKGYSRPDTGFTQEDEWIAALFADAALLAIQNATLWDETSTQREHFHHLVAGSPDGVITNDREGHIQVFNQRAEMITGFTEEEMKGKPVQAVYADPHEAYHISQLLHQLNGKLAGYATFILGKGGRRIPIRLTGNWLYDSRGISIGTVGYFEDLRVAIEQEGRLDLLAKASTLLSQAQNLTDGLQQLAEMLATFWGAAFCRIFLLDEEQRFLTMRAVYPLPGAARRFSWQPDVGSITAVSNWEGLADSLNERDSFILRNTHPKAASVLQQWTKMLQLDQDIQSLLVVPLRTRDKVVGLLDLGNLGQETPPFEERENLAITIAAQTAVLIDRISLHESTERRGRLLAALDETLRHIHAIKETPKLLQETVHLAADLTGCSCGGFCINSPHTGLLTLTALYNLPDHLQGAQLKHGEGLIGEVARTGQLLHTNTYPNWPNPEPVFSSLGFQTLVAVPLRKDGEVEAVLFVADRTSDHSVLTVDLEILERFAVQAAIVMQTSLLVNNEQRLFARWTILHRMSDYFQANHELEPTLHVFLTCITAGYGLAYNRAALFLVDEEREMLIGRLGIGHVDEQAAHLDWERDQQQGLDLGRYLANLETKSLAPTPLGERILILELPLEIADAFNQVLQNQRPTAIAEEHFHQLPSLFTTLFEPTTPVILVPLLVHGRAIGLLVVDNKFTQYPVTPDDLELLLTFSNTAASAIEKTQLLEKTEAARNRLHSFYKASNDLVTSKDPEQIWRDMVEQIRVVAQASRARMRLIDPIIGHAQDLITTDSDEPLFQGPVRPNSLSMQVMASGKFVKVEDSRRERERVNPIFLEKGILAAVGLPVSIEGDLIGVVWIYYNHSRRFSASEIETYQFYVNQAAIAYDSAKRIRELETLQKAVRSLTRASSLKEVCQQALKRAAQLFGANAANIWLYDQQRQTFIMGDAIGFPPELWQRFKENLPRPNGFAMEIMKNGWSGVQDVEEQLADLNPAVWGDLRRMNLRSFQGIALAANQKNLGVLYLNYDYPRHYPPQEQKSLQTFAQHISLAISKVLLLESMQKVKDTTGIIAQMSTLSKLDDTLDAVAHGLHDALDCDVVTLHVYEPDKATWIYPPTMVGVHHPEKISTPTERSIAISILPWILDEVHQLHVVDDVRYDPVFQNSRFTRDENIYSSAVVPLQVSEERVGVVLISYRSLHRFAEEELDYIHLFTNQAAVAIHNAQLYELQQRQATALLALDKVAQTVTDPDRLRDDVLTAIAEQAWKLTRRFGKEARFSNVVLLQGRSLEFLASYPLEYLPELRRDVGIIHLDGEDRIGIMGHAVETGEPLLVSDVRAHPDYLEYDSETRSELAVPVKSGSQVIGVINVEHPVVGAFDNHDLQALLALAEYASIAIQNAALFQNQQRQKLMLEALYAAGQAMTSSLNLDEILREIIVQVRRHTENQGRPASYTSIWLVQEDLTAKAFITHPPEVIDEIKAVIGEQLDWQRRGHERIGIIGRAIQKKKSVLVADVSQHPDYRRVYPNTRSELAVPIILADEVIGVLNLEHTELAAFDESDRRIVEALARQAAIAIQNARLYNQVQRQVITAEALYDASQAITGSLDIDETLQTITQQAARLTGAIGPQATLAYLARVHDEQLTFAAAYPADPTSGLKEAIESIDLSQESCGITGRAVKTGRPQLVKNVRLDKDYIACDPNIQSVMAVPIKSGTTVKGVIVVESPSLAAFDEQDEQALVSLAGQASLAIQNAEEHQETLILQQLATSLVGVLELADVLALALAAAMSVTGTESSAVIFWDEEAQLFRPAYRMDAQDRVLQAYESAARPDNGMTREILKSKQVVVIPDTSAYPNINPLTVTRGRVNQIVVPLWSETAVIGALYIHSLKKRAFSQHQLTVLETLASLTAVAINKTRQYQELKETKGIVGSRTALAWMGMASNAWRHSIEGDAVNVRNLIPLLRGEIHGNVPNRYFAKKIEDKLNHIEKLAGQILDRPITPPLSSEQGVEEVIISDLIQERVQQLWKDEHFKNVPFPHLDLQEAAHSKVWISPEWLRLAFDLLVDNAVEAMEVSPMRQLTIAISEENKQITLAVKDSGKGIPPELQGKLFEVTLPEARRYGHLGRGLLMVQAIVQTYGGDVKEGETGPHGTTMIITLPKHA
jgi:PAS domain S-box-containing protein